MTVTGTAARKTPCRGLFREEGVLAEGPSQVCGKGAPAALLQQRHQAGGDQLLVEAHPLVWRRLDSRSQERLGGWVDKVGYKGGLEGWVRGEVSRVGSRVGYKGGLVGWVGTVGRKGD